MAAGGPGGWSSKERADILGCSQEARGVMGMVQGFRNLRSHSQGYPANSSTNWRLSSQTPEPAGNILIQTIIEALTMCGFFLGTSVLPSHDFYFQTLFTLWVYDNLICIKTKHLVMQTGTKSVYFFWILIFRLHHTLLIPRASLEESYDAKLMVFNMLHNFTSQWGTRAETHNTK